jgi:putative glutamine amidotransferase
MVSGEPLVAVTGRRIGKTSKWPYAGAVALPRAYPDAVRRAGGQPVIVDHADDVDALVERVDGLVLTGGPDLDPGAWGEPRHEHAYGIDPAVDAFELALARAAIERRLPTLAICRGCQVLNVALGGSLYQHIPDEPGVEPHGRPGEPDGAHLHTVDVDTGSLLAEAMGATQVVASCHHHQAVAKVGAGLRVTARAHDGIVEGLEHDEAWVLAVQWHPEDTAGDDPAQQRLFDALVARTAANRVR